MGGVGERGGGDEMEQRVNRVMVRGKRKEKDGVQERISGGQVCWICGWIVWQASRQVPFP